MVELVGEPVVAVVAVEASKAYRLEVAPAGSAVAAVEEAIHPVGTSPGPAQVGTPAGRVPPVHWTPLAVEAEVAELSAVPSPFSEAVYNSLGAHLSGIA